MIRTMRFIVAILLLGELAMGQATQPAPDIRELQQRLAGPRGARPLTPEQLETLAKNRELFLQVERIARLEEPHQLAALPRLYRELTPPLMNLMIEGMLSSYPAHILVLDRQSLPPGFNAMQVYDAELEEARATMTPEEAADA